MPSTVRHKVCIRIEAHSQSASSKLPGPLLGVPSSALDSKRSMKFRNSSPWCSETQKTRSCIECMSSPEKIRNIMKHIISPPLPWYGRCTLLLVLYSTPTILFLLLLLLLLLLRDYDDDCVPLPPPPPPEGAYKKCTR